MARVLTNNTCLSVAAETSLGVAGTDWNELEVNNITSMGATISKIVRDPISKDRQRKKGIVSDLDSQIEFDQDLTINVAEQFVEGFLFATSLNSEKNFGASAIATNVVTIDGDAAAAVGAIIALTDVAPVFKLSGFANAANNGEFAASAATASSLTFAGLTDEAGATAKVEFIGLEYTNGATLAFNSNELTVTLADGGLQTDSWLLPGQSVFLREANPANSHLSGRGLARVNRVNSGTELVLDKLDAELLTAATTASPVRLITGTFTRNVAIDSSEYLERSFTFEAAWDNLGSSNETMYEYSLGNYCNTLAVTLETANKVEATLSFIGTDTEVPTTTRKTGADAAVAPTKTDALSATSDVARLSISKLDETGITTDFKSLSITLRNNVSPEKVIGTLGAKFINVGQFHVDMQGQLLFTDAEVVSVIRNNETVSLNFSLQNDDGLMVVDIPEMTMGDGARELPVNETVLVNTTGEAHVSDVFGYSVGVTLIAAAL